MSTAMALLWIEAERALERRRELVNRRKELAAKERKERKEEEKTP